MLCLHPEAEAAPAWFVEALADSGEIRTVEVRGARVEYRVWGPYGAPVVVLVHGGAAHGGWWDHLAPHLAKNRRVAALDLSGHGSSGSRTDYDFLTWADEVVEVASAEGSDQPFVIGHSMGGVVALTAAFRHAGRLTGTVVIDPPDWVLQGRVPPRPEQLPTRRHHATRELAEQRFRARPSDPRRQEYVERHVAERSVHRTADGWTWRFDHTVTTHDSFPDELWGTPRCPVVVVLAERSLLSSDDADLLADRLGGVEAVTIADSGHHIMLDQPLALLACLEDVLSGWLRRLADAPRCDRPG
jgi:pimeloyl-ACP methyl ester carboxylesterase